MRFQGARAGVRIDATEKTDGVSHYFIGAGARASVLNAGQYRRITYRNLYRGISLVLRGDAAALEYDFVVAPFADPASIHLAFDGSVRMELIATGDFVLYTPAGELRHRKPIAFQEIAGKRKPVEVSFALDESRHLSFRVGAYDPTAALVIDPAVVYTSASVMGQINGLTVDSAGNVYMTGSTPSVISNCWTSHFFGQSFPMACDAAFVAKLDPTGAKLLYYTILAGTSENRGVSIAVNRSGIVYVLGETLSADFPVTSNAVQSKYAGPPPPSPGGTIKPSGGDLFVAKLDPLGGVFYSTFLGGPQDEYAGRIRLDPSGNVYVSARSASSTFPTTPGAYLTSPSTGLVVAMVNPTATQVTWATWVDITEAEPNIPAIDLDATGALYVAAGAAVAKLSADGGSLIYKGTFGQTGDITYDMAVDPAGNAWVVGESAEFGGFIREVNSAGSGLAFSTTFGHGNTSARALSVALDSTNRVYVGGTATDLQTTPDAILPNTPNVTSPGFLSVLAPNGTVTYASYAPLGIVTLTLGGSGQVYTTDGKLVTKMDLGGGPPLPYVAYAADAASLLETGIVQPGELLTLFGQNLGPGAGQDLQLDANGNVGTLLAGTRVLFDGVRAPVLYVQSQQVKTVVPFGVHLGTMVQLEVEAAGQRSSPLALGIQTAGPEIFTLPGAPNGQIAALNEDGTMNSPQNPAPRGSVLSLFATGGVSFTPPLADGQIVPVPPPALTEPVQVFFQGELGDIVFAGAAPGSVAGEIQINVRIPTDLPAALNLDAVNISLRTGTGVSQATTTVAVR